MESIGRASEWALSLTWPKDSQFIVPVLTSDSDSCGNASMYGSWEDSWSASSSWMADLPHAWSGDYREPIFTFTSWKGQTMGVYSMSIMYWVEMLSVGQRGEVNQFTAVMAYDGRRLTAHAVALIVSFFRLWCVKPWWQWHSPPWCTTILCVNQGPILPFSWDLAWLFRSGASSLPW